MDFIESPREPERNRANGDRLPPPDDLDLVDREFACPRCGEREVDNLLWQRDGVTVECQTCGRRYKPA